MNTQQLRWKYQSGDPSKQCYIGDLGTFVGCLLDNCVDRRVVYPYLVLECTRIFLKSTQGQEHI